MSRMIPDGLPQLREYLRSVFTNIVPEAQHGTADARESNFLSRALAAYAVEQLANCSVQDAAASVVDGADDGGIDAIFYDRQKDILWAVQSKFSGKGSGLPDGLEKFRNGVEALLLGNLDYFAKNNVWKKFIPTLDHVLDDSQPLQVRAVFVYSSLDRLNEYKLSQFEQLKERFSPHDDYFTYTTYNLSSILDWLTGADIPIEVPEVRLTIHTPGWSQKKRKDEQQEETRERFEAVYGLVKLTDLAALYAQYGEQLIAANIRGYIGDSEVNQGILATLREEPHTFAYLNNGLTAYCDRLSVANSDRGNNEFKRFTAKRFSIVNGAQTLGTIAHYFGPDFRDVIDPDDSQPTDAIEEGYVFLKLISLERCENEIAFAQKLTRTTNSQNQIRIRHFVAQDSYQQDLARMLQLSGIQYHFRDDVTTPPSDKTNFALDEATTALACLAKDSTCDLIRRIDTAPESLWSFEALPTANDSQPSRYHSVFQYERPAREVWRAVQIQRIVLQTTQTMIDNESNLDEQPIWQARWLLLHLLFDRLRLESGAEMALNADETSLLIDTLKRYTQLLLEILDRQYSPEMTTDQLFSNATTCIELRNAMQRQLHHKEPSS